LDMTALLSETSCLLQLVICTDCELQVVYFESPKTSVETGKLRLHTTLEMDH
jgi:hypothetical protein